MCTSACTRFYRRTMFSSNNFHFCTKLMAKLFGHVMNVIIALLLPRLIIYLVCKTRMILYLVTNDLYDLWTVLSCCAKSTPNHRNYNKNLYNLWTVHLAQSTSTSVLGKSLIETDSYWANKVFKLSTSSIQQY